MQNMGPLNQILKMIPGMNNIPGMDDLDIDDREMDYMKAIILSMTEEERKDPDMLSQGRRKRIAKGSARSLQEVNRLITQFKQSREMMSGMSDGDMPSGMDDMLGDGGGGNLPDMSDMGGGNPLKNASNSSKPKKRKRKKKKKKKIKRRRRR